MGNDEKAKASAGDGGEAEVTKKIDKEQEAGISAGEPVDPTPNENYTVAGVNAGKPTPETDPKAAEKAKNAAKGG